MNKPIFSKRLAIGILVFTLCMYSRFAFAAESAFLELATLYGAFEAELPHAIQQIWKLIERVSYDLSLREELLSKMSSTRNFDSNDKNPEGLTPLLYLLTYGLREYPSASTSTAYEEHILGFRDLLENLLKRGASTEVVDTQGRDALTLAVIKNNRVLVHLLVEYGAQVKPEHIRELFVQFDKKGVSESTINTGLLVLETLLPYAQLEASTLEGLLSAAKSYYDKFQGNMRERKAIAFAQRVIETLLLYHPNPYSPLYEELYDCFIKTRERFFELTIRRNAEAVFHDQFSEYGLRKLSATQRNKLLLVAADCLKLDIIKVLVACGAHVNYCSEKGETPLRAAVEADLRMEGQAAQSSVVRLLLKCGARVALSERITSTGRKQLLLAKARDVSILRQLMPKYTPEQVSELMKAKLANPEKNINYIKKLLAVRARPLTLPELYKTLQITTHHQSKLAQKLVQLMLAYGTSCEQTDENLACLSVCLPLFYSNTMHIPLLFFPVEILAALNEENLLFFKLIKILTQASKYRLIKQLISYIACECAQDKHYKTKLFSELYVAFAIEQESAEAKKDFTGLEYLIRALKASFGISSILDELDKLPDKVAQEVQLPVLNKHVAKIIKIAGGQGYKRLLAGVLLIADHQQLKTASKTAQRVNCIINRLKLEKTQNERIEQYNSIKLLLEHYAANAQKH
jgi:ankyrin repeat protein